MIRASESELPSTPEGSPDGSFSGMSVVDDGGESFIQSGDAASLDGGNSEGGWSSSSVEKLQLQYWTSLPTATGGGDGIGGWGALPMQILRRGGGAPLGTNTTSSGGGGGGGGGGGSGVLPGDFPPCFERSTSASSGIVFAATLSFPLLSGSYEATARVGISTDASASEASGPWRWLGKPNDNTKLSVQAPSPTKHRLLPEPSYRTMSRLSEAMAIAAIALSKQSQAALLLKGAGGQRRNSYGSSRSYLNENLAAAAAAASAAAAATSTQGPLKPLSTLHGGGRSYHLPVSNAPVQLPSISHHQALLLDSLALSPSTVVLPKHINMPSEASPIANSSSHVLHSLSVHSPQIRAALSSSSSSPNLLTMSSSSSSSSTSSPSSSSGALRQSFVESASVVYSETAASLSMRASSSSPQGTNNSPAMMSTSSTTTGVGQSASVTAATICEIAYVSALISILVSNWASTSSTTASAVLDASTTARMRGGGNTKYNKNAGGRGGGGGVENDKSFTALVQLIACLPVLRQPAVRTKFVSKILGIEMCAAILLLEGVAGLPLEVVLSMSSPAREARLAARRTALCRNAISVAAASGGGGGGGGGIGLGALGALSKNFKQYMSSSSSAASTMSPKSFSDSPRAGGGLSAGVSPYLGAGSMSPYLEQPVSPIASLGGGGTGGGIGGRGPHSPNHNNDDSGGGGGSSVNTCVISPVRPFVLAKLPPAVPPPLSISTAQAQGASSSSSTSSSTSSYSNFAYVSLDDIEDVFDEDGLEDADILAKLSPHASAILARRIAALKKTESKVISRASSRASMRQRIVEVPRSPARGSVGGGGGGSATFDNIDIDGGLQSQINSPTSSSSSSSSSFHPSVADIALTLPPTSVTSRAMLHSPTLRSTVSSSSSTSTIYGGITGTSPLLQPTTSGTGSGRPPLHSDAIFMLPAPSSPVSVASSSPRNLTLTSSSSSFRPPAFLSPSASGASIHSNGNGGGAIEKRSLTQAGINGSGGSGVIGGIGGGGIGGLSARPFETTFFCSVMSTRQRALYTLVEWASGHHWRLLEVPRSETTLSGDISSNGASTTSNTFNSSVGPSTASSSSSSSSTMTSATTTTSTSSLGIIQDHLEAMSLELCINALHHVSPAYVHKRTVEVIVSSACASRAGSSARIFLTRAIRILFGKGAVCGPEPVLMRACYPVLVTALPSSAGGRGVGGGGGASAAAVAASSGLSTCITLRAVPNLSRVVAQCISESLFTQLYENRSKKKEVVDAEMLFSFSEALSVGGGGGGGGVPSLSEQLVPSPPHPPSHPHLTSASPPFSPPRVAAVIEKAASFPPQPPPPSSVAPSQLLIHLPRTLDFREHMIGSPVVPLSSSKADLMHSPPRSIRGSSKNNSPVVVTSGGEYSPRRNLHPQVTQQQKQQLLTTSRIETLFDFSAICALMADLVLASCAHAARSESTSATGASPSSSSSSSSSLSTSSTTTTMMTTSGVVDASVAIDGSGPPPRHHGGLVKRRSASRANMVASPPRDQQHEVVTAFPLTGSSLSPLSNGAVASAPSPPISALLVGFITSPGLSIASPPPPFSTTSPPPPPTTGHHHVSSPQVNLLHLSEGRVSPGGVAIDASLVSQSSLNSLPKERLTRLWFDATRALALASLSIPVVPDAGVGTTPEFRSVAACTLRICSVNDTLRDVFLSSVLRSWPKDASDSEAALLEVINQVLLTGLSSFSTATTTSSSSSSIVNPSRLEGLIRKKLVARLCRSLHSAHIRVARNALIVLFNPALQITSSSSNTSNRVLRSDSSGEEGGHHPLIQHQQASENENEVLKARVVETLKIVSDRHWNHIVRASTAQHLSILVGE